MKEKNKIFHVIADFFMLTVGAVIAAFAIEEFLVPCTILDGGVIGVGIMVNNLTHIPLSILTIVFNIPFLLIGSRKLGLKFILKSAYSMVIFSIFLEIFAPWVNATDQYLLAVCFGGVILGAGVGIIIRWGGCLDGTETVAILLNRKFKMPVGRTVLIFNIVIYIIAGFLFGFERAMYSLLTYFITSKIIDLVETGLEQAKAAESIARQQLSHSTLTAPFAGVIAAKNVDLGTYVLPGQPVLKLANVAQVNAKVSVPEAEISHLHVGDKVKLTVAALSGAIFRGTISEKGIDANPISHTYDVKVGITNPQGRLLPGMVCNAQVQGSAATPSHITVPPQSIELDIDNSRFVWTVVNGKAHQQPVTTGDFEGNGIVILSGLKAGDQVIINGQQKVSEGMNVDTAKSDNR